MKRRTFFKACAGALAGVVGWAMKPKQTDGIFTEDDYKSLSSDYTIGDELFFEHDPVKISKHVFVEPNERWAFTTHGSWSGCVVLQRRQPNGSQSNLWQDVRGAIVLSHYNKNMTVEDAESDGAWFRIKSEPFDGGDWNGELTSYFCTRNHKPVGLTRNA